jgi:hypothetical protein
MGRLNIVLVMLAAIPIAADAAEIGKVLYQDDFSNPASGWVSADLGHTRFDYDQGARRIVVTKGDVSTHDLLPGHPFANVSIEVDATLVDGSTTASLFGLICRATAGDVLQKAYQFYINADGAYALLKLTGPQVGQIQEVKVGKSDALQKGNATNHLRADCAGNKLAMYANGQQLLSAEDADFASGQVGFAIHSNPSRGLDRHPGFEVHFDNFVVREATP